MDKKDQGEDVVIKGKLYREPSSDIYNSDEKKTFKFDTKGTTESVATEATSQAAQSGVQAVIAQVQTQ